MNAMQLGAHMRSCHRVHEQVQDHEQDDDPPDDHEPQQIHVIRQPALLHDLAQRHSGDKWARVSLVALPRRPPPAYTRDYRPVGRVSYDCIVVFVAFFVLFLYTFMCVLLLHVVAELLERTRFGSSQVL